MGEIEDEGVTRLDGNAAAGVLTQVFCGEPSGAVIICAGCGATAPIGALPAYGLELGAILRCPHCDTAVLRVGACRRNAVGRSPWRGQPARQDRRFRVLGGVLIPFPRLRPLPRRGRPARGSLQCPRQRESPRDLAAPPATARGLPPPCRVPGHRPARARRPGTGTRCHRY